MKILCFLFLLFSVANAQEHVAIVSPTGDTATYVKQRIRTVHVHDTVTVTKVLFVHDTVRAVYFTREVEKPYQLNVAVAMPIHRDTVDNSGHASLGVFGFSTYRANMLGPAYSFTLGPIRFFLTAGVSYLSDYEKRQVIANAGVAAFASF